MEVIPELVHAFKCKDKYLALDVESGSLHEVDEPVFELLDHNKNEWGSDVPSSLIAKYGDVTIQEACEDIASLIEEGWLYTQEPFIEMKEAGNVFKALCLHVSHACNLQCIYCFAGQGQFGGQAELMSADTGKKALDFLMHRSGQRKHLEVDFFGGEPLLNFDIVKEIVAYGRILEKQFGKKISFTITTNGLNMNEEIIDYFNEEMDNVVISIDGRKDIHDRMRPIHAGTGSFDAIVANAKAFVRKRKGSYYIRGTFTRQNLDFAKDVLFLADEGFAQLSIEPVVAEEGESYSIRKEDMPRILEEYEELVGNYIARKKEGRPFQFFHFMLEDGNGPCYKKRVKGCGAGYEYAAVAPDGTIYPCHQFVGDKDLIMGHVDLGITNKPLSEKFADCNILSKPQCHTCWAKYHCGGGCAANAYKFNKDIAIPYETGCTLQKRRIECGLYALAVEKGT